MNTFTVPLPPEDKEKIVNGSFNYPHKLSKGKIITEAFKAHSEGKFLEALKLYEDFINQGYFDSRVFSNYGSILKDLGELEKAEKFLHIAINQNPQVAQLHYNHGNILKDLNKLEEAEVSIRKSIKINPDFAEGYLILGSILKGLKKLKQAEISTLKAIQLNPKLIEAHLNLAIILQDLGKLEEAEISIRKAIQIKPDYAQSHYQLGCLFKSVERLKEAESSFRKAIELKIGFIQAHNELTCILEKLGKDEEAKDSSKKALYLNSINSPTFNSQKDSRDSLFRKPKPIEYPNFYRSGMGTENIGSFLRSMVMMIRPKRILEIGAGYTTPFLLEGLINNERVFDDGNLSEPYFKDYIYDAKLVIIDNKHISELTKIEGMNEIIQSQYTDLIEGNFQGMGESLFKQYGSFDFVWLDCGERTEYSNFFQEYWQYCSNYIFFHYTYLNGLPNIKHKIIQDNLTKEQFTFDFVEPHKKRQGSITMVKKK